MIALFFSLSSSHRIVPEERAFRAWMKTHNYNFVGSEYRKRYAIFAANSMTVKYHNSRSTFKLSLNKFAAYSNAEFRAIHPTLTTSFSPKRRPVIARTAPDSVDWRYSSYVPDVVDAGSCAPWPFAAVVPFSFLRYNQTQQNVTFSAQNLIDCVVDNKGCYSGNVANAYRYLIEKEGGSIESSVDYPLNGSGTSTCKYDSGKGVKVISGYQGLATPADENELLNAVATYGPVVTAVDASVPEFQLYGGGVFDTSTCSKVLLNQPLVIVGYGSSGEGAFWIAQNSWGTNWGEKGYIRIKRGSNVCGIATNPIYPILQ
jgi:C1A family cysteine protease